MLDDEGSDIENNPGTATPSTEAETENEKTDFSTALAAVPGVRLLRGRPNITGILKGEIEGARGPVSVSGASLRFASLFTNIYTLRMRSMRDD